MILKFRDAHIAKLEKTQKKDSSTIARDNEVDNDNEVVSRLISREGWVGEMMLFYGRRTIEH